ncbi:MAG: arsenate reductase family protein [Clostridia bacterium]|nr:arsenate reductase family protein [Clostridia bacterium]
MKMVCYPRCTTCQRAMKWLSERGEAYEVRDIKEDRPTEEELRLWHTQSGMPMRKLFNTSGLLYRSLGLKDRLAGMTEEEMLALLSSDGMLIKRPILIGDGFVLIGFKEAQWDERIK